MGGGQEQTCLPIICKFYVEEKLMPFLFAVLLNFKSPWHLCTVWIINEKLAWIRSAVRLPNKQSIDGRSKTRQFQRPSGKKTLSLSQLIRSHLYCYERVSRIEGLEPMSLLTTVLRCCPKTLSHCRQSSLSLTSGLTTVLRCCRKTLRQSSLGQGDMLHIPQDNMA